VPRDVGTRQWPILEESVKGLLLFTMSASAVNETTTRRGLAGLIQAVRRRYFVYLYHPITVKMMVAVIALGLLLVIVSSEDGRAALDGIHQALRDRLVWSAILIFLLFIMATLSPSFPEFMIIVMSGFVFGVLVGSIFSIVCIALAASANFSIARRSQRRIIEHIFDLHSVRELRWTATRISPAMVFLTWFLPSINFDLISYAAGMSKMKYQNFVMITVIGTSLSSVALAFLGDQLRSGNASTVVVVLLAYTIIGIVLYAKEVPPWFSGFADDPSSLVDDEVRV